MYEHLPPIGRTSLSPDGKRLAVVTVEGSVAAATNEGSVWIVEGQNFGNARRSTDPINWLGTVQWSPDGRWLLVEGERPAMGAVGTPWDTLWLVDPDGGPRKDLMPPGSPFRSTGHRWIQDAIWLDNDRVYFPMHCGSGCVGHYSINIKDTTYWIFCIGSGQFEWAPNRKLAVAENYGSGPTGYTTAAASGTQCDTSCASPMCDLNQINGRTLDGGIGNGDSRHRPRVSKRPHGVLYMSESQPNPTLGVGDFQRRKHLRWRKLFLQSVQNEDWKFNVRLIATRLTASRR